MPADIAALCADLTAETAALELVLAPLDDHGWSHDTPAEGWTVRDQISHLAYFDEAVVLSIKDPTAFVAQRDAAVADVEGFTERIAAQNRGRDAAAVHEWFVAARTTMIGVFVKADPSARVPWYGPDMSIASAVTARIMETWAHGQDITDALGVPHEVTPAVRHVAFIGVRAFPNSFIAHGLAVPEAPVRVELVGPDGDLWEFGPADADDVVRGPAVDFGLVVTQRRHLDDVAITTRGDVAADWMRVAQAFAGPPGSGRAAGQFKSV
jgi:uncharacterized protein (TIGR03084 family)